MVHLHTLLGMFWRDLQLSEIILKEEKKEGRKVIKWSYVKIKFAYSVCSVVHDESGLCLEVSGLLGISQKCAVG